MIFYEKKLQKTIFMILSIKHKASYYKRFELDIWGVLRTSVFKDRPQGKKNVGSGFKSHARRRTNFKYAYGRKSKFVSRVRRFSKKQPSSRLIKTNNVRLKKQFSLAKKKVKKLAHLSPHFLLTFFHSKLIRIFDFFYKSFLTKQEYKRRARRRYIYRVDIIQRRVFKKKIKKRFVSLRLVKLFYLTLHYHQFRQLARRMRQSVGCFEHNFFMALEGRLVSFIYRTSLVPNPFQCINIVKSGNIVIEGIVQGYMNYLVKINQLVRFLPSFKRIVYLSIIYRLARGAILFNPPRYIYVSFLMLYMYMKRPPHRRDLVFPISVDMYRATGYAF